MASSRRPSKGVIQKLEEIDEYLLEALVPDGYKKSNLPAIPQEYNTWLAGQNENSMDALMEAYDDMGVKYIQWRCMHGTGELDSKVRSSHASQNLEVVHLGNQFSNGLYFPGDFSSEDPSETMNCRCGVLPFLVPKGYVTPGDRFKPNELVRIAKRGRRGRNRG